MCGRRLEVVNSNDLSQGIVLTLLDGASEDIRNDADVRKRSRMMGATPTTTARRFSSAPNRNGC